MLDLLTSLLFYPGTNINKYQYNEKAIENKIKTKFDYSYLIWIARLFKSFFFFKYFCAFTTYLSFSLVQENTNAITNLSVNSLYF